MSYLVLARKYRPKTFSEVVGQVHVVKTLINALKTNKVSHALLFSGIKGSGKTTIARILAKALNCHQLKDQFDPCNQCGPCEEINKGIFVDVIEIDAASNRGIDQVRELIENLRYAPAKGRAKVYIIDEAHMLTKEAANALLKSLEEPPGHVYFILATTEPNKLPPTILSRCQRYDFRRIDFKTMVQHLRKICESEGYPMDMSALELIAKEAQGSLRDALTFLDQAMAYGARTKEDIINALGWHEEALIEDIADILLQRDLKRAMTLSQELFERGIDFVYLMEKLTEFFRTLFLAKAIPGETKLILQSPSLRESFIGATPEELLLIFQILLKDLEILKRSPYPHLQFELTLAKICEFEKLISIREILQRVEEISKSQDFIISEPKSDFKDENRTIKIETWEDFIASLEKESSPLLPIVKALSQPTILPNEIVLSLRENDHILRSIYLDQLKEKIEKSFGKPVKVNIQRQKHNLSEDVRSRPEVQNILKAFSAKIAYIEPVRE